MEQQKAVTDSFSDTRAAGSVIGTSSPSGTVRKGVDRERAIAIDNGALRIVTPIVAGWGREGIAYGPYTRVNGIAIAAFLVNGHNTSQAGEIGGSLIKRLIGWAVGSKQESLGRRLRRWVRSDKKESPVRRFWRWTRNSKTWISKSKTPFQIPELDENLAVGWFPSEVPANPLLEGNALIVHATGPENGELWARVGTNLLAAFKGLQNLQLYYIVVLREQGAAYYAASVPNAYGLVAYPDMRPIAIDPVNQDATVYAALYQSVLGQIGFSVDTRVYAVNVQQIPELATWYGTAHAADSLIGNSKLVNSTAEVGGIWTIYTGTYERTLKGTSPTGTDNLAVIDPGLPSGLIHALVEVPATVPTFSILWRVQDQNNFCSFQITGNNCQFCIQENGTWRNIAASQEWCAQPNTVNSVQILDDGKTISLYLNGKLVFNTWFTETYLQTATGIGIFSSDASDLYFRHFEAHPRSVPIPTTLDLGSPWMVAGKQAVITDNFTGVAGELAGKTTSTGEIWRKDIGKGVIELSGNSAVKVRANAKNPNPDRTAYTVAWDNPNFADVQVEITPPGTQRGQQEKGRGGLIFWQDTDNYITISTWLDDDYAGASVSSFFYLNGFEELYDAVWTNVGSRIYWGIPYVFRVVFDGINYTTYINNEPVLYRALTDIYPNTKNLLINRVGIVANWEWGNDTGSVFKNFVAKV